MVDHSLYSFSVFDPVKGNLHMRNSLSSSVLRRRFVELSGEKETSIVIWSELFLDKIAGKLVYFLICFLWLTLGGIHEHFKHYPQEFSGQLKPIPPDNLNTLELQTEIQFLLLPRNNLIKIIQFPSNIFLLHEQDKWLEDTIDINFKVGIFFVDLILELICYLLDLQ